MKALTGNLRLTPEQDERRRAAIRAAACAIHCAHLPRQYGRTTRERFARFYRAERQTLTSMKP